MEAALPSARARRLGNDRAAANAGARAQTCLLAVSILAVQMAVVQQARTGKRTRTMMRVGAAMSAARGARVVAVVLAHVLLAAGFASSGVHPRPAAVLHPRR